MNEPIGSLCVLLDDNHTQWIVSICQGQGRKQILRRFESRDKAAEFAMEERARLIRDGQPEVRIQFPDDCPCIGDGLKW